MICQQYRRICARLIAVIIIVCALWHVHRGRHQVISLWQLLVVHSEHNLNIVDHRRTAEISATICRAALDCKIPQWV
jgi:hypothetical protein